MKNNSWFFVRLLVLLAVVGGLGYLAYRYLFAKSVDQVYDKAQSAYVEGLAALDKENYKDAAVKLDEAVLLCRQGLDTLEETLKNKKDADQNFITTHQNLQAKFLYLKARALRDHYYARSGAEGKPLPLASESWTGDNFRVYIVPDEKVRKEAFDSLRTAAARLKEPPEVFIDALRTEQLLPPEGWNWDMIRDLSEKILAKDAKDIRCHFLLARYHFEQPASSKAGSPFVPTPESKRRREDVLKARQHIEKVQEAKEYPLWRTLYLQAQMTAWLANHYAENKKEEQKVAEEQALRRLLSEAPARAKAGEGFKNMTSADVDGVLEMHLLGLRLAIEDQRKADEFDARKVLAALDTTLAFCETANEKSKSFSLDKLATTGVRAVSAAQPYLVRSHEAEWKKRLENVKGLAKEAVDAKQATPQMVSSFVDLLSREAHLEQQRGNMAEAKKIRADMESWVAGAIKAADERKAGPDDTAALHLQAAYNKLLNRAKRADIKPHLDMIEKSRIKHHHMGINLIEGALEEREGRLSRARTRLEKAIASEFPDIVLRGHMAIINVYMALGQPADALASLRELEKVYKGIDELSEQDRAWAMEFVRSPQELAYLQLIANLETAKAKVTEALRKNPKAPVPAALTESHEREADRLLRALPLPPNALNREARLASIRYLLFLERDALARDQLAKLRKDFPESLGTLQLDIALAIRDHRAKHKSDKAGELDPKLVETVDGMIKKFKTENPDSRAGKIYWASWLVQTKRADEAIAFLESPLNFPKKADDDDRSRALALAFLGKGEIDEARKVLQHLEKDPNIAALLVQMTANVDDQKRQLSEAVTKFENAGLFRCQSASLAMREGKLEEACREYMSALDYSRVSQLARNGLQGALFALARTDPAKTRELCLEFFKSQPSERNLLLAYAFASVMLDDIGAPDDSWDKKKNMASAINLWEAMATDKESPTTIFLTKAEVWSLAGRDDIARGFVVRAMAKDDARPHKAMVALALANPTAEHLLVAEKHARDAAKLQPDSADADIWLALIAERTGKAPEAMVLLENLLAKHPKDGRIYSALARILLNEKQPAKAREWAQKWLALAPDNLEAATVWIQLLAADKKVDEAREFAKQFVGKQMKQIRDRLPKDAKKELDKEAAEKQAKSLEDIENNLWLDLSRGLMRSKAYDEAEVWVKAVLKSRPDDLGALVLQGEILLAREKFSDLKDHYEMALVKHPANFMIGNNLAWLLAAKLGNADKALELARPLQLGKFSKKALPGNRLNASFLDTLGVIYTKLNRPDLYPEMRDLFEAAAQRYSADPRMFLFLGHAYRGLGERTRAEAMYATAISLARAAHPMLDGPQNAEVLREAEEAQKRLKDGGA